MEFRTKHIGAYSGKPASIIELTVISDNTEVTETINEFSTNKVDENFIMALRELADELEDHNNKLADS